MNGLLAEILEARLAFHALSVDVPPRGRKRRRHAIDVDMALAEG
jgi:hypothetical protein